jgi:predicted ferric reductase
MINTFDEAYLCGAPVVVDSMEEKLNEYSFKKENIFTEKY